jgi:hypothetical protein
MLEGKGYYFFLYLGGGFVGKALRNRRPVHEAVKAPLLKSPLVLVELAPGDAVAATSFTFLILSATCSKVSLFCAIFFSAVISSSLVLVFGGSNTLTEEKTDCHFYVQRTVRDDLNFYT